MYFKAASTKRGVAGGGCCVEGAKRLKWTRPRLAVPMAARTPPQMVSVSRQIIALL